jgi:hypothetical protein
MRTLASAVHHYCGKVVKENFLVMLVILHFSSMALMVTFSGYFGVNLFSSISYFAEDGHCLRTVGEGIGLHCFGDYSLIAKVLDEDNPWLNELYNVNYGAPGLLPFLLPKAIEIVFTSFNAGLVSYLLMLAAALTLPVLLLAVRLARRKAGMTLLAIGAVLTGPLGLASLIVLDRGNSVGFAFPVLAWFTWAFVNGKYRQVGVAAVLALLIRPQFALLLLALIFARKYRLFLLTGLAGGSLYFLSYLVFIKSFPQNIGQSVSNILYFSNASTGELWPPNMSIARGVRLVLLDQISWTTSQLVAFGLAGVLLVLLIAFPTLVRPFDLAFALLVVASLASSLTGAYYLLFAQVAVLGVLWDSQEKKAASFFRHSPSLLWAPGLVLSLAAFPILTVPMAWNEISTLTFAPIGWVVSLALLLVFLVLGILERLRHRSPPLSDVVEC